MHVWLGSIQATTLLLVLGEAGHHYLRGLKCGTSLCRETSWQSHTCGECKLGLLCTAATIITILLCRPTLAPGPPGPPQYLRESPLDLVPALDPTPLPLVLELTETQAAALPPCRLSPSSASSPLGPLSASCISDPRCPPGRTTAPVLEPVMMLAPEPPGLDARSPEPCLSLVH